MALPFYPFITKFTTMPKYRVSFENKEIKSIHKTPDNEREIPGFHEEHTGRTIQAIINASDDDDARTIAKRLEIELQTGVTKENLNRKKRR
jgi:plasmid maintenance system killer protein